MTAIQASGVSMTLSGRKILKQLEFDVKGGELTGLIGPNGAGKTTILRLLAGLIEQDQGVIEINSRSIMEINRRERSRMIAYLPSDAPYYWPVTVRQIVSLGRLPYSRWWRDDKDAHNHAVGDAMKAADVLHLADRRINTLSSGERVRALFARALAGKPKILLTDEPTSALDPYHQLHVMEILRARSEAGDAVVAVLHDLALAARFCHRIILLKDGVILGDGPPARVLNADSVGDAYGIEAWFGQVNENFYLVPWKRIAPLEEDR